MLMTPGEIHHLRDFGLSDLVGEDAANSDATLVDMQHDLRRVLLRLIEKLR